MLYGTEHNAVVSQSQIGISWNELASILEFGKEDAIAMLYRTYIDDSADERKKIAVVAGAFVATHGGMVEAAA